MTAKKSTKKEQSITSRLREAAIVEIEKVFSSRQSHPKLTLKDNYFYEMTVQARVDLQRKAREKWQFDYWGYRRLITKQMIIEKIKKAKTRASLIRTLGRLRIFGGKVQAFPSCCRLLVLAGMWNASPGITTLVAESNSSDAAIVMTLIPTQKLYKSLDELLELGWKKVWEYKSNHGNYPVVQLVYDKKPYEPVKKKPAVRARRAA